MKRIITLFRRYAYLPTLLPIVIIFFLQAAAVIERELAKEIGLLRETHAGNLQGTDGSTVNQIFLGKRDKDFSFADLKAPVDFCETSVLNEENLDRVQAWISSISC